MTEKEIRQLIASHYFQRSKVRPIFLVVLSLAAFALSVATKNYFLIIYMIIIALSFFCSPYLIDLKKTHPKRTFRNRWCEIDQDFISFIYEDGSLVKLRFDDFTQVIKKNNYYLMYTTYIKNEYFYLPISAFNTEQDISQFDLLMQEKQLMKLW